MVCTPAFDAVAFVPLELICAGAPNGGLSAPAQITATGTGINTAVSNAGVQTTPGGR